MVHPQYATIPGLILLKLQFSSIEVFWILFLGRSSSNVVRAVAKTPLLCSPLHLNVDICSTYCVSYVWTLNTVKRWCLQVHTSFELFHFFFSPFFSFHLLFAQHLLLLNETANARNNNLNKCTFFIYSTYYYLFHSWIVYSSVMLMICKLFFFFFCTQFVSFVFSCSHLNSFSENFNIIWFLFTSIFVRKFTV